MSRPSFITTKGQRNDLGAGGATADDILDRLEDVFAGKIVFEGMPEDMPEGYAARALFNHGAVGMKDTSVGRVVLPAKPATLTVYGTPRTWLPAGLDGYVSTPDLFEQSDTPVLWLGYVPRDKARPYANVLARALRILDQNIVALSQPVVILGSQGGEINAMLLDCDLSNGKLSIPCLDKVAAQAMVLDLKAQDHTQNLLGVVRAMWAEMLTAVGIPASSTEKASGMTVEETEAGNSEIFLESYTELAVCSQWCKRINSVLPDCSVRVSGWEPPEQQAGQGADTADKDEGDDDDGDE